MNKFEMKKNIFHKYLEMTEGSVSNQQEANKQIDRFAKKLVGTKWLTF